MLLAIEQSAHGPLVHAASLSFFVFIITVNILWITVKAVLWAHGDRGWFILHTRDLQKLKMLAAQEADSSTRISYEVLRYALHASFVLLFVVPLTLLAIGYLVSHAH
jgi:hypothetical protein